jgi:hypothetical protein
MIEIVVLIIKETFIAQGGRHAQDGDAAFPASV